MNRNTYFIDANILMYAIGTDHQLKEPSIQILRDCVSKVYFTYTSIEVLQEILHRYTRLGERERAIEASVKLAKLVTQVIPVTPNDFSLALKLHREHTQLVARDSLHAATMLNHNFSHMVSADRHFDNISGFVRVDPKDWTRHVEQIETLL